jgi:plasmid maintenance system antidote protein VapI
MTAVIDGAAAAWPRSAHRLLTEFGSRSAQWISLRTKFELLSPHLTKTCGGKIEKRSKIKNLIFKWWARELSHIERECVGGIRHCQP